MSNQRGSVHLAGLLVLVSKSNLGVSVSDSQTVSYKHTGAMLSWVPFHSRRAYNGTDRAERVFTEKNTRRQGGNKHDGSQTVDCYNTDSRRSRGRICARPDHFAGYAGDAGDGKRPARNADAQADRAFDSSGAQHGVRYSLLQAGRREKPYCCSRRNRHVRADVRLQPLTREKPHSAALFCDFDGSEQK